MAKATAWKLENPDSLDLFLTWRSMGAQPPSLSELLTLPGWLIRDFQRLSARYYRAKERKREREKGSDVPPSPIY